MNKNGRWKEIKTRLIQIAISVALISIAPFILSSLNKDKLNSIQDASKNLKLTNQ